MAKFALVGYGSDGLGVGNTAKGYTYVVSDNVRTLDIIHPVATSRAGRKFATTGVINHAYKETSIKGQDAKQQFESNENKRTSEISQAYTGKELGASGSRIPAQSGELSEYTKQTRAGQLTKTVQKNPNVELTKKSQQTFDEYSKKYMGKGE